MTKGTQRMLATIALILTVIAEQNAAQDQSLPWACAVGAFAYATITLVMWSDK